MTLFKINLQIVEESSGSKSPLVPGKISFVAADERRASVLVTVHCNKVALSLDRLPKPLLTVICADK